MVKTLERAGIDMVRDFVLEKAGTMAAVMNHKPDPFWKGLRDAGTELWLDTGDIDAAGKLWTDEFSGLTTNNTLLNKEVQKGIYDQVIREAGELLKDLDTETRVVEVAFILNALHGLRLVKSFKAKVSVELHTATAHDAEAAAAYGEAIRRDLLRQLHRQGAADRRRPDRHADPSDGGDPGELHAGIQRAAEPPCGGVRFPQLRQRVPGPAERLRRATTPSGTASWSGRRPRWPASGK